MSDSSWFELDAKIARLELDISGLRLEISRFHPIPLKAENKEFCKSIIQRIEALERLAYSIDKKHRELRDDVTILESIAKEHDYKINKLLGARTLDSRMAELEEKVTKIEKCQQGADRAIEIIELGM